MVSPYSIKLEATDMGKIGRTAGNLYAVSTLAGVFSALLVGFFLIPEVGVTRLTLIVGSLLLVTAAIGYLLTKKSAIPRVGAGSILMLAIIAILTAHGERPDKESGLVSVAQSPFGEIRVIDIENDRHLVIDGGIHSMADTSTWNSNCHYAAVMNIPKYFFDKPGSMLLIGLGGGSLLKQYSRQRWQVDAVEIDPVVIRTAYEYFGLKRSEGNVIEMDGRQFLSSTDKKYDVILIDAYGSSSIPFHLVTREAFGLISSRLNPGGIAAINVETIGWDDPIVASIGATLRQNFREVLALPMEEPPDQTGNIVLIASNRKLEPLREPERNVDLDPDWRFGPGYQKVHAWDNRFSPDSLWTEIFTDDLNRVDLRAEAINLAVRKELHGYFKGTGSSW
jgi:spermidine synthase